MWKLLPFKVIDQLFDAEQKESVKRTLVTTLAFILRCHVNTSSIRLGEQAAPPPPLLFLNPETRFGICSLSSQAGIKKSSHEELRCIPQNMQFD